MWSFFLGEIPVFILANISDNFNMANWQLLKSVE